MHKGMTLEQCRERHRQIAGYVEGGHTIRDACREFQVSSSTVRDACFTNDVTVPRLNAKTEPVPRISAVAASTLEIIAALQNTAMSYERIGQDRGISRQAVRNVAERASKAGIRMPSRSRKQE